MNNKLRQLILVLGIMFVIGAATGITVQQILISQINQTNGENFTKAVMPLDYVINSTVGTWKQNENRSIELTTSGSGGFTTQNSTGCVLNTVYQNTNSTARFVSAVLLTNGAVSIDFMTDATNPPTVSMWTLPASASAAYSVYGTVLPNNYFKINVSGSPTLYNCAAWN